MINIAPVVTIDGPSSAGKGVLSQSLAKALQWRLLDSGTIYRALAMTALRYKANINNEKELIPLASNLNVCFNTDKNQYKILLEGHDVSQTIRAEIIGQIASSIAQFPSIRKTLLFRQRAFRTMPGLIADGRDMGTMVFPDAVMKVFLYASLRERAKRRMEQLHKNGFSANFSSLILNIKERDDRDRSRAVAPLEPACDALMLDSTCLSIDEVVAKVLKHAKQVIPCI